jgi:hypothetical protein
MTILAVVNAEVEATPQQPVFRVILNEMIIWQVRGSLND